MMKKNGFTLAEVLITLAIIGVVATLTLPSLMSNTAEQQSITAFKKVMNTLNEAGQMNAALEGFDYTIASAGSITDSVQDNIQSLCSLFNERLQVSKEASGAYGATGKCKADPVIVLRDGTAICIGKQSIKKNKYWLIYVDTNGPKGPNALSVCKEEGCITKASRQIKDQYGVTIAEGIAVPGHWSAYQKEANNTYSYAARYAMGIGKREQKASGD